LLVRQPHYSALLSSRRSSDLGGLIVLVGALDDRIEMDSLTKLAGQVTAAGVLVLFGGRWWHFWVPGGGGEVQFGQLMVLGSNQGDRKSTRLNSSHVNNSYAVF